MKNVEWWRGTATHMWRVFFALKREKNFEWNNLTPTDQRIYAVCHHVYLSKFVKADQDILQNYFTSRWGDDIYVVEDYSLKNNIPVSVIWMVIHRANRAVIEEVGLLERKNKNDT